MTFRADSRGVRRMEQTLEGWIKRFHAGPIDYRMVDEGAASGEREGGMSAGPC